MSAVPGKFEADARPRWRPRGNEAPGLLLLALLLFAAIAGPALAPFDPLATDVPARL